MLEMTEYLKETTLEEPVEFFFYCFVKYIIFEILRWCFHFVVGCTKFQYYGESPTLHK